MNRFFIGSLKSPHSVDNINTVKSLHKKSNLQADKKVIVRKQGQLCIKLWTDFVETFTSHASCIFKVHTNILDLIDIIYTVWFLSRLYNISWQYKLINLYLSFGKKDLKI